MYEEQCSKNNGNHPSNLLYRDEFAEARLKLKLPSVDTCKTCDEYKMKSKHSSGEVLQLLSTIKQNHKNMVDAAYKSSKQIKNY